MGVYWLLRIDSDSTSFWFEAMVFQFPRVFQVNFTISFLGRIVGDLQVKATGV